MLGRDDPRLSECGALALCITIFFKHTFHIVKCDMIVMTETSPEVPWDVHQLVDDRFVLFAPRQLVEPLGNELENVKSFDPQRDL